MPWLVEHLFPPWIQPSHLFTQAVCGYGSQEVLALRPAREGELYFPEDREVNLVELALATNIPKGCAETAVRGDCRGYAWGGDRSWVVGGVVMGWLVDGAELRRVGGITRGRTPG